MEPERLHRTLVVANRTAATPLLLAEVERRAGERPTAFVLLRPTVAARRHDWTLDDAVMALRIAASGLTRQRATHVEGIERSGDPFEAVKATLDGGDFDDVIVSTLPSRTSEWLRRDLPHRIEALGVPVTVVTLPKGPRFDASDRMLYATGGNPKLTAREEDPR
jgi:hypothetical protein